MRKEDIRPSNKEQKLAWNKPSFEAADKPCGEIVDILMSKKIIWQDVSLKNDS